MILDGLVRRSIRHRLTWRNVFILVAVVTIFVNESLVYFIQSYRWPAMPETRRYNSETEQVLLLVADPQIQGYQDEPGFPWGTLARWDIDRYLYKTFSYAYSYSQPDVVLYLGDLMDEGSRAIGSEYMETLHRFQAVFAAARHAKNIYIPGDNDIGGEGRDFRTYRKLARFERHFGNISSLVKFGFIDYFMLNLQAHALAPEKIETADRLQLQRTSPMSIMLNHETLISNPKHFVFPVLRRLRPKVVISAHWHKATVFLCDDCMKGDDYSWNVDRHDTTFINSYLDIDVSLHDCLVEIAVPTCSYRMGTRNVGYGVAIIGSDQHVRYTVLWLPRRYTMLYGYLVVFAVCLTIYFCQWCMNGCRGRRR